MKHAYCMLWGYSHKHRICNTYSFSAATVVTRKLHSVTSYVQCLCWRDRWTGQSTDDNMTHAHCMLENWDYSHKHRICNTYSFSAATVVTPKLHCVTSYVQCLSWRDRWTGQSTDDNMTHAHCMLENWGYTHKHRICNTYSCSAATVVTPKLHCVTSYVQCLCWSDLASKRAVLWVEQPVADVWRRSQGVQSNEMWPS